MCICSTDLGSWRLITTTPGVVDTCIATTMPSTCTTQGATSSEFECPQCQARYKIVRVDAGLQTINRPVYCKVCRRPFTSREGEDILKYFLTDRPKTGSPRGR